jgi:hypothetical protein
MESFALGSKGVACACVARALSRGYWPLIATITDHYAPIPQKPTGRSSESSPPSKGQSQSRRPQSSSCGPKPTITLISARFPTMETPPVVKLKRRKRALLGLRSFWVAQRFSAANKALRWLWASAPEVRGAVSRRFFTRRTRSAQVNCSCQRKLWTTAASTATAVAAR